jgi:hypothetical protein
MPDNTGFMIVAYIAVGVILAGYLLSLVLRVREFSRRGGAIGSAPRS